jgi:two-component system chemotaxis response regulator CheB
MAPTNRRARVLVVDDSTVVRRLLVDALGQDPAIEVVGTAANGKIALQKLVQLTPDLVTLDIEMPDMDGLETLLPLRKSFPKLPVIMFSTLTARGAVATLDALSRGATDYVTKPANVGSVNAAIQCVRDQLVPKIKALCPFSAPAAPSSVQRSGTSLRTPRRNPAARDNQRKDLLVIGSSTGGPQALATVLTQLPASFPLPIVIVQHMPPIFTRHLADRLNQECRLSVTEAQDGDLVQAGRVLIAPGDFHLVLERRGVQLACRKVQSPPENSCRPAVDVLFRSAAALSGPGCLGLVLTGMGRDGCRGSEEIVSAGGDVLVQNEATSVVWGMPRAVAETGLADGQFAIGEIAPELLRRAAAGRLERTCR